MVKWKTYLFFYADIVSSYSLRSREERLLESKNNTNRKENEEIIQIGMINIE